MSTRFELVATDVDALCGLAASASPPGVCMELKRVTTSREQQVVAVATLTVTRGVPSRTVTEWLAAGLHRSRGTLLVDGIEVRLPQPARAAQRQFAGLPRILVPARCGRDAR